MKKWLLSAGILAVLALGVLAFAVPALGQAPATPPNQYQTGAYCGGAGGYGMMGGGYVWLANPVTLGRVADTLGLTSDELTARLQQGETLAQIAEAQNVSAEAVVAAILAPHTEMLQIRVKYGYLTQAEADAIQEQATQSVTQAIGRTLYGASLAAPNTTTPNGAYRGGRGYGGMMGGGFGGGVMGGRGGMMGW